MVAPRPQHPVDLGGRRDHHDDRGAFEAPTFRIEEKQ
jgi:hypothetical protein